MRMESDLLLVDVIELVYRFTLNSEVEIKVLYLPVFVIKCRKRLQEVLLNSIE